MSTFIGNIEAKADEKGRIFVPAGYRKILSEGDSRTIIMRRDTENDCLIFYPESVWNQKVEQLRQALDEWDPEDQLILMQFMSDAESLETDSQGRVLLNKKNLNLLQGENADNNFVFIGMLDRFALWNKQRYEEQMMNQHDLAIRIRNRMKANK